VTTSICANLVKPHGKSLGDTREAQDGPGYPPGARLIVGRNYSLKAGGETLVFMASGQVVDLNTRKTFANGRRYKKPGSPNQVKPNPRALRITYMAARLGFSQLFSDVGPPTGASGNCDHITGLLRNWAL